MAGIFFLAMGLVAALLGWMSAGIDLENLAREQLERQRKSKEAL